MPATPWCSVRESFPATKRASSASSITSIRRDANVIYDDGANGLIHVSGHGSQEEMRLLINLVRPKFFIPVHGDYRYLKRQRRSRWKPGPSSMPS